MSLLHTPFDNEPSGGGVFDSYPDVDQRSCQLLGPTALVVQGLLGVLVLLSLVYKRHRETPKRPWRIWLFDVSKQVVGQMFVHGANLFLSDLGSNQTASNACVLYFLNILIDTTLGVALLYFILHFFTFIASEKFRWKGFESGVYGSPPSITYWARQAAIYVLSLTTMKLLVVALLALFPGIFKIGEWILEWTWTKEGDALQVVFTMGIFPIIMNIVQFWLIDSIVKASNAISLDTPSLDSDDHEHREPLFRASSDDEDDDIHKPNDLESQRRNRLTRSSLDSRDKSSSTELTISDEYKSNASTSDSTLRDEHSYPPSLSSSISSLSSSAHDSAKAVKLAKGLIKKKRRDPPAPLYIQPVGQPAVNSPQLSAVLPNSIPKTPGPVSEIHQPRIPQIDKTSHDDWNSWNNDDWVERADEDEWTGSIVKSKGQADDLVRPNHGVATIKKFD